MVGTPGASADPPASTAAQVVAKARADRSDVPRIELAARLAAREVLHGER